MSDINKKNLLKQTRVGPAGWSYKDWCVIVYPLKRSKDFSELEYLSQFFDTIEINSTFYRPPNKETSIKWVKLIQHNANFEFTTKLWQRFTHERGSLSSVDITTFKQSIWPLLDAGRLGALLLQFPWSFKNTDESINYLKSLCDSFPEFPLVVEFRHKSWQVPATFELLRQNKIGFVNIDQPVIGDSITPSSELTSDIAYVRFHGRNYDNWFRKNAGRDARYDYLYENSELQEWIKDLKKLEEQAGKSFFIYNNHFQGKAVVNGFQLLANLSGEKMSIPEPLIRHYPQLQEIACKQAEYPDLPLFK